MRRASVILLVAFAILLGLTTSALAGQGGGKSVGKLTATIDFMPSAASSATDGGVSFAVTRSRYDNKDTIWVTTTCYDAAGSVVVDVDRAVQWGEWNSLDGVAGPFYPDGATCTSYVTIRPWLDKALSGATLTYSL